MKEEAEILTERALALPVEQKRKLMQALVANLKEIDEDVDQAWFDEAEDRAAAYDRGEIQSYTLEEIIASREAR